MAERPRKLWQVMVLVGAAFGALAGLVVFYQLWNGDGEIGPMAEMFRPAIALVFVAVCAGAGGILGLVITLIAYVAYMVLGIVCLAMTPGGRVSEGKESLFPVDDWLD